MKIRAGVPGAGGRTIYVDIRDYGGVGDGVTDNTAAINNALLALCPAANSAGGTLAFPAGVFLVLGRIVIPVYGGDEITGVPGQTGEITIRGVGSAMNSASNPIVPNCGTVLDLRYAAGNSKIVSLGMGHLVITDLLLADFGSDTIPFGLSTNTTVHLNRVGFYGVANGSGVTNDGWHFGGTDIAHVLTENSHFAGFGTTVENCWFNGIATAIYGGAYFNGNAIMNNNVWARSGKATGGAFEFFGDAGSSSTGNYIVGNLFEMSLYKYGIYGSHFSGNYVSNSGYDSTATTVAFVRWENGSVFNIVVSSMHDDAKPFVSTDLGSVRNATLNAHQSQMSYWSEPWTFGNTLSLTGSARFLNTDLEYWEFQGIYGATPQLRFNHHANAGADTIPFLVQLDAGVNTELTLLGNGTMNNIGTLNAPGGFVINAAAGSSVWPIGVAGGIHFDVNTANCGGIRNLTLIGILNQPLSTPASSAAAGNPGDLKYDANFIYVCTAVNTWKRVALVAF